MSPGERLLAWFGVAQRQLPWRRERNPYAILVAEVMLQQTQVAAVVPYFERFLLRFPDVAVLAAAPLDAVLAAWRGLGYYRRARALHQAAAEIVRRGAFPATAAELRELPGVGAYTAAAVASIGFGEAIPVLDGNVARVLSRLIGYRADPGRAAGRRILSGAAAELLDPACPGDSNQALMELGATVCRPRQPRCAVCPLAAECVARAAGETASIPRAAEARSVVRETAWLAVVARGSRTLFFRRGAEETWLAGLWELPTVLAPKRADAERALAERYGGAWRLARRIGRERHGITFRDLTLEVWSGSLAESAEVAEGREARWIAGDELPALPTSAMVEKALRLVANASRSRPAASRSRRRG